jgi:CubicO group peptidase (beta-lactamase class C family)
MGRSKSPVAVFVLTLGFIPSCDEGGNERFEAPREYVHYEYLEPGLTGDGWQTASLSDVAIDEAPVVEAVEGILNYAYQQVHSLLIVRNGMIVLEEYFRGHNRNGALVEYDRDRIHDLASVTKSVTSIMTGLAIDSHFIGGVHDPALMYLPEYQHLVTPEKARITIEHLLTMTSGWEWSESTEWVPENDMYQFNTQPDPLGYLIAKTLVAEPGTVFAYNGGAVTLLGKIIERASGLDLETFSDLYLFSPMGIEAFEWPYMRRDLIAAHGDLDLRPRDMAKLGQMMLNGGVWNERRILPAEWVEASWRQAVDFPPGATHLGYGYLWWLRSYGAGSAATPAFCARGWGGQNIIVLPVLDTVVVFTGGNYRAPEPVDTIMEQHIIPAIVP